MDKRKKEQQIFSLVQESNSVLICLPENPSTDAIASGLAMLAVVERLEKRAKVVSAGFQLPANHSFLPKSNEIFDDIASLRKFIISIDVSRTSIEELSYDIEGDNAKIYITPKDGMFSDKDVSTSAGNYAFDLVIVIDAHDLQDLGRLFEQNTEFFYDTPVVNIGHRPENTHYGQVNLVTVTATSSSEVIFELVKDWEHDLLDEYVATNLLTGMISKTKSFQSGSVTPRSLSIASHLISQGARREDIVKHLYQSKQVSTLKLWGRALSKLKSDEENKIVWSLLRAADFEETKTTEDELDDVIDELIINTPDAKNVFLLCERKDQSIKGLISTAPYINAMEAFEELKPSGDENFVSFEVSGRALKDLEQVILGRLRKKA